MNLNLKSMFVLVAMMLAIPMTAWAHEGDRNCRHAHRSHGHHGPPAAEIAFRWQLGGAQVAFRPAHPHRPAPRHGGHPAARDTYRPQGNDAYVPRGNDTYVPRGNDTYVPRGDDAYVPRGNAAYRPRGRGARR